MESPLGSAIEIVLSYNDVKSRADSNGIATFDCMKPNDYFVVKGYPNDTEKFQDMYIYGFTGSTAFNYTTFYGTRAQAKAVFHTLDIDFDPSAGIAVVGLDISNDGSNEPSSLVAAVGAGSTLHYDGVDAIPTPFIYEGAIPKFGSQITERSQSFVTYPNIPTKSKNALLATSPNGLNCLLSPGLQYPQNELVFEVVADSITVVSYICADAR